MSRGEILEHKGEGLYRVRQKLAVERIQQELTQVQARLAELAVELPTAKLELIHADDAVRDKAQEIDALIPDYAAGADGALQQITALQAELIRLQSEAGQQRLKVAELIAEDLANRKRQNQLELVPEGREMDLWCADYSVELTGEVGLVDINDEGGQGALIQPGFENGATYDAARDGALFPNLAQSGAQIYLNAALLPGVQKWRPRYRIGTITKLNGDACNVDLDPAQSSAQDLNISQAETLQQVPIKYMDCNGLVFEEDDRVLVRFTQSGPLVVGFAENPKACDTLSIAFMPARPFSTTDVIFWGKPLEDSQGNPINPPLGTLGGSDPSWFMTPSAEGWNIRKGNESHHGRRNWIGPRADDVLSWDGPASRMFVTYFYEDFGSSGIYQRTAPGGTVYHKGSVLMSTPEIPGAYLYVRGAAFRRTEAGIDLIMVASNNYLKNTKYQMWRVPMTADYVDSGPAELLGTFEPDIPGDYWPASDWYFNASGTDAVCTFVERLQLTDPYVIDLPGKATYLARWSIAGASETEKLISYDDVIGTNHIYRSESGSLYGPASYEAEGVLDQEGRSTPLYADYIADEEVIAYVESQGFTRESKESLQSSRERTEEDDLYASGSETTSDSIRYRGHNRIFLSNGSVVAELGDSEDEIFSGSGTWSRKNSTPLGGAGSVSHQASYYDAFDLYAIDARFGFAVVGLRYVEQVSEGSGPFVSSDAGGGYTNFQYALSGHQSYSAELYIQGFISGEEIFKIPFFSESLQQNSWRQGISTPPRKGDDVFSSTEDVEFGRTSAYAPSVVMDCAGVHKAGKRAVSVQIYKEDSNVIPDGWVRYHYITGYPDPENDLFENPGDNMTMYALTLI